LFCNHCGIVVDQNAKICPGCGQPVSQERESTKITCFDPVACSRELECIIPPLQEMESNYSKMTCYGQKASHAGKESKLVVNIGCVILGAWIAYLLVNLLPSVITLVLSVPAWAITTGMAFKLTRKPLAELQAKEKVSLEQKEDTFREKYIGLFEKVCPILEKYIPEDYRYSTAVQRFCFYFRNYRADTMKEAVNLYEEEMHRLRLENAAELVLRENQKQTAWLAFQAFELATL